MSTTAITYGPPGPSPLPLGSDSVQSGSIFGFLGLTLGVLLLSLQSFYFYEIGLPIVSISGGAVCLFSSLAFFRSPGAERLGSNIYFALFGIVVLVSFSGFLSTMAGNSIHLKAPGGILFGVLLLGVVLVYEFSPAFLHTFYRALNIALCLHVVALFFQIVHFQVSGDYLDYVQPLTGEESRYVSYVEMSQPRYTGLFVEPAMLATFFFMGLLVRIVRNSFTFYPLDIALCLGILMTSSLTGYFFLAAITGTVILRVFSAYKTGIIFVAVLCSFLYYVANPEFLINLVDRATSAFSADTDIERFRGFHGLIQIDADVTQLFGKGFGNYDELEDADASGGNGLVFMLYQLGLVGTFVFFGIFAYLLKIYRAPLWLIGMFLMFFFAAPALTNLFWWLWVALLMTFNRRVAFMVPERTRVYFTPIKSQQTVS